MTCDLSHVITVRERGLYATKYEHVYLLGLMRVLLYSFFADQLIWEKGERSGPEF